MLRFDLAIPKDIKNITAVIALDHKAVLEQSTTNSVNRVILHDTNTPFASEFNVCTVE